MTLASGSAPGISNQTSRQHPGDMQPAAFRQAMHKVADLVADYLEQVGDKPVLPAIEPGTGSRSTARHRSRAA
jgi:hypothetical protein